MIIGVTVTERERRGRVSGKPKTRSSSSAQRTQTPLQHLFPYKLPIHPKCLGAPSSFSTLSYVPSHTLTTTVFFLSVLSPLLYTPPPPPTQPPVPLHFLLHCLDLGRLELPSLPQPPVPSQLWITWRPRTQRLPGPPDDSQPDHNKWLTALFT